jgi:hypothetical protein
MAVAGQHGTWLRDVTLNDLNPPAFLRSQGTVIPLMPENMRNGDIP